ncbi:MAG: DNA repair protein, partial [Aquificota bacterium]
MRIKELYVEGFGGLGPLSLSFAPGLNLILGPNEAGKTCLMEFIRAALFGLVKRDGAYQRYLPLDGRPYGGRVVVEEDGG